MHRVSKRNVRLETSLHNVYVHEQNIFVCLFVCFYFYFIAVGVTNF